MVSLDKTPDLDAAYEGGALMAYRHIWAGTGLREDPLSGEWADETTISDVYRAYGEPSEDDWFTAADSWEAGYLDVANGLLPEPEDHPDVETFLVEVRRIVTEARRL